jgi:hypothetical protein
MTASPGASLSIAALVWLVALVGLVGLVAFAVGLFGTLRLEKSLATEEELAAR